MTRDRQRAAEVSVNVSYMFRINSQNSNGPFGVHFWVKQRIDSLQKYLAKYRQKHFGWLTV